MIKRLFKNFKIRYLAGILILSFVFSNAMVVRVAQNKTYNIAHTIPANKVGLVLGTGKYLSDGTKNLYFIHRINATVELYKLHKIEYVLISGDNSRKNYNEPEDFKQELIKKGIPENKIFLDFAGFRTLDSVVRAKEIFGQKSITIISQKFHNERAIFIASKNKIYAIGFNAKDVNGKYGLKVKIREYFARIKVMIDIFFNVQPKFLGKKIHIA